MTGLDMQFVIKFIQERAKIYVIYCQNELRNNHYSFLKNIKNIQNDLVRYNIMLDDFPFKLFLNAILI